jgi:hypothetical protein
VISFQRETKTYQGDCVPFDSSIAAISKQKADDMEVSHRNERYTGYPAVKSAMCYVEFIFLFISLIRSSVEIGF